MEHCDTLTLGTLAHFSHFRHFLRLKFIRRPNSPVEIESRTNELKINENHIHRNQQKKGNTESYG